MTRSRQPTGTACTNDTEHPATTPARCPQCFSRRSCAVDVFKSEAGNPAWRVVQCNDCELMYTDRRPADDVWERYYTADYPAYQLRQKSTRWYGSYGDRLSRWLLRTYRGYSTDAPVAVDRQPWLATLLAPVLGRRLDPYILPLHGTARLLDVGCGSGAYLARMQKLGWDVAGIEPSARMAQQIRSQLQIPVTAVALPSNDLPDGRFDLITAWQVLEHMERPRQALACIHKLLHGGGRLALTVPNQAGWAARWFRQAWIGLDLPRHLVHFTPATLARMLESEGFSVVHQTTIGASGWIRKSAREAARSGSPIRQRALALKSLSRLASSYACHRGAGESIYVIARPVAR